MKIAITGGAGFIGERLVERLQRDGHECLILDVKKSEDFPELSQIVDITNAEALDAALDGVDLIYHLAAEHRDDVHPIQKYYDVNVGGAENLVASARRHGIDKIIWTSTVAVYGLDAGESRETNTPNPFNDYGKSKLESEKVFDAWVAEDEGRTLVTIRLVATFGPKNRGNIFNLMNQIYRNRFFMVGDGENHKTIAYVENVAEFLVHCLSLPAGSHLYNYADKPDLSMNEFVSTVRRALGREGVGVRIPYPVGLAGGYAFDVLAKAMKRQLPISSIRVKKFCASTVVNADKLRETGFEAPHSIEEGLEKMIAYEWKSGR